MIAMLGGIGAFVVLYGVLTGALVLWLVVRLFRVRWPAQGDKPERPVGFGRALGVNLVLNLVGFLLLALAVAGGLAAHLDARGPLLPVLVLVVGLLVLVAGWVVFALMLPTSRLYALAIYVVWMTLAQFPSLVLVPLPFLMFSGYVVPTGAMADTIYGYHKEVVCPRCGLPFAVNASAEADQGPGFTRMRITRACCPGCYAPIQFGDIRPPDNREAVIPDPGLRTGDRILVGRRLLGAGLFPPRRFDVVVFDWLNPADVRAGRPTQPIPYVMRVIGLPGERIAIHRGKLFVLAAGQEPAPARNPDENHPEEEAPGNNPLLDAEGVQLYQEGRFQLLRKGPRHLLALRRLVYDTRYPAKDLAGPEYRRWVADKGWSEDTGGYCSDGAGVAWLRYRHVLRDRDGPRLITDFVGYNTSFGHRPGEEGRNYVGDLMLECAAEVGNAGVLTLELSRGPDRFQARFDLGKQSCSLVRLAHGQKPEVLKETSLSLPAGKSVCLRFANIDERLTVWVDDRLPFGDGVEYEGPRKLVPTRENDLERPASVGTEGAAVKLAWMRLFRDNYYTTLRRGQVAGGDVDGIRPDDPETWNLLADAPVTVYRLGPGQYFMLGDNSPQSADSRFWGAVPAERLQGQALWRYFPLERQGAID
jgi:signal peptidase I